MPVVLFLLSDLEMGGSQKKIINVANRMHAKGRDVHMLVLGGPYTLQHLVDASLPFVDLKRSKKYEPSLVGQIRRYVADNSIDEVCVVGAYPLIYAIPALRFTRGRPRISLALNSTFFRGMKERLQMVLYIPLMLLMDSIIFGCKYQRDHWMKCYRVGKRHNTVIYNGIDTEHYSMAAIDSEVKTVRESYEISYSEYVIGSVGKFRPEKGYEYLIEAVSALNSKGTDVTLLLVGAGIQEEYFRNRVAELGIDDKVIFFGETDDVRHALAAMDVFVLSSVAVETFSNAALEAMGMSRPLIMSRLSGAPEMIDDGVQGMLYKLDSVDELVDRIEKLADPKVRQLMSDESRKHVVKNFSMDRMVSDYEVFFEIV